MYETGRRGQEGGGVGFHVAALCWGSVLGMDEDGPLCGVPHPVIKRREVARTLQGEKWVISTCFEY